MRHTYSVITFLPRVSVQWYLWVPGRRRGRVRAGSLSHSRVTRPEELSVAVRDLHTSNAGIMVALLLLIARAAVASCQEYPEGLQGEFQVSLGFMVYSRLSTGCRARSGSCPRTPGTRQATPPASSLTANTTR